MIAITLLVAFSFGQAQSFYKIEANEAKDVTLYGTSSLHDWEMDALSSTGNAQFVFDAGTGHQLLSMKSLSFVLLVADLKSNNNGLNANAYEALKADKYKDIRFTSTSSTVAKAKEGFTINLKGNLTIAGVTKEIEFFMHCTVNGDGSVNTKGSYKLKMTDYNVIPPSFMWGAMKTGDDLTLAFNVIYKI